MQRHTNVDGGVKAWGGDIRAKWTLYPPLCKSAPGNTSEKKSVRLLDCLNLLLLCFNILEQGVKNEPQVSQEHILSGNTVTMLTVLVTVTCARNVQLAAVSLFLPVIDLCHLRTTLKQEQRCNIGDSCAVVNRSSLYTFKRHQCAALVPPRVPCSILVDRLCSLVPWAAERGAP